MKANHYLHRQARTRGFCPATCDEICIGCDLQPSPQPLRVVQAVRGILALPLAAPSMAKDVEIPAALRDVWAAKKDVFASNGGDKLDLQCARNSVEDMTDALFTESLSKEAISVNVNGCSNLTDESIKAIASLCPSLVQLNVGRCTQLTDVSIVAIAAGCPSLQELTAWGCENLTDESIKAIAVGCPSLVTLNVHACENLTDASIKAIAAGCPSLTSLDAWGCVDLTDEAIKAIAAGCPSLASLDVERCRKLTDASIKAVGAGCLSLLSLNVSGCEYLTEDFIFTIATSSRFLKTLDARGIHLLTLPVGIGDQLPHLEYLDVSYNKLTTLPRSIVKLKKLKHLNVYDNPLQSPPLEIASRGLSAVTRYFEELAKGSSVSKLLKVVLVGDGEAGKTSLRNALARRPHPRQAEPDRTIHLDIEKVQIDDSLDINIYDCGGQREYLACQLPYLTGVALYVLAVDALYAADEYLESKLHRFLIVMQNRVPGAVVLPIVTKVDTVEDSAKVCRWLEIKIADWIEETHRAATSVERKISLLRVQPPALPVSVDDAASIQTVRDAISALTKQNPPLLRGVGQQIPSTYMSVLELFGAIAEHGNDELALKAVCNGTAQRLGESSVVSPNGTYRPRDSLEALWNRYRNSASHLKIAVDVFENATELWDAQGIVFIDSGLVFLQPSFMTKIVKPLVDHRLKGDVVSGLIETAIVVFLRERAEPDKAGILSHELKTFVQSGELCSPLLLAFLWRYIASLEKKHYGEVLEMLAASGVIFPLDPDGGGRSVIAVVPFRLTMEPDPALLAKYWPEELEEKERLFMLKFKLLSGCPAGLAERFASDTHHFGITLYCWIDGAIVKDITRRVILTQRTGPNELMFSVRLPGEQARDARRLLCEAQNMLDMHRKRRFVGLVYTTNLCCEVCKIGESHWDAKTTDYVCTSCGHASQLGVDESSDNGASNDSDIALLRHRILEKLDTMEATMLKKFDAVIQKAERNHVSLESLARQEHKFPNLFILEPADKESWSWFDYLTFADTLVNRRLRIVFICSKTLLPVPYDGQRGLEFAIVRGGVKSVLKIGQEFCQKYGPAIRICSAMLAAATKRMLDFEINMSAAGAVASDAVKRSDFVHYYNYAKTIGRLIDGEKGLGALDSNQAEMHRNTVLSYMAFGEFLKTIGFDPKKLPMRPATDERGNFGWVCIPHDAQVPQAPKRVCCSSSLKGFCPKFLRKRRQ